MLQLHPDTQPMVLIVAPLKSLVTSQQESWAEKGVKTAVLRPQSEMTFSEFQGRDTIRNDTSLTFFRIFCSQVLSSRNKKKSVISEFSERKQEIGTLIYEDYLVGSRVLPSEKIDVPKGPWIKFPRGLFLLSRAHTIQDIMKTIEMIWGQP